MIWKLKDLKKTYLLDKNEKNDDSYAQSGVILFSSYSLLQIF